MQRPSNNAVTQPFGYDRAYPLNDGWHKGIDYSPYPDDRIYAPEDGRYRVMPNNGGLGNAIHCFVGDRHHAFGHISIYLIEDNQYVKRGTPIAIMGSTGASTGTHLHHALAIKGILVDPVDYYNEPFIKLGEEEMITKDDVDLLRIGHSEIGGWDFVETHTGKHDQLFLDAWAGKPIKDFIREQWKVGTVFRGERVKDMNENPRLQSTITELKQKVGAVTADDEADKQTIQKLQAKISDIEKVETRTVLVEPPKTEPVVKPVTLPPQKPSWFTRVLAAVIKDKKKA